MQHVQDILLLVTYILAQLTTYITPLMFKRKFGLRHLFNARRPHKLNNNKQTVHFDLKL